MIRQLLPFRSILIRECSTAKPIKITQVGLKKISKKDQLKNVNLETRILFGKKTKAKATDETSIKDAGTTSDGVKGMESEIRWVSEKKNIATKSTTKKKKKEVGENEKVKKKLEIKPKKIKDKNVENASTAFLQFKYDMPQPVKVTIKDALDDLNTQINSPLPEPIKDHQEIPFNTTQLRNISLFPLILQSNDITVSSFSNLAQSFNPAIPIPSVSKILQATMTVSQKNALMQWKSLKIAELGLEGFEAMQKAHLGRGKMFHECVQKYFNGEEVNEEEITSDVREIWHSITPVLSEFESPALLTEKYITHPYLKYKGVVDCVSMQDDAITVIEWKNSERHKKSIASTYDAPIQLCAYLAALNATDFQAANSITKGVIVVAYNDGQAADMFKLNEKDLNRYWKMWLSRLQEYWVRYRDNTLSDDVI